MNILVDVDEVLRSLMREVLRVYKEEYDINSKVKFSDITTRDLRDLLKKTPFNANDFFIHHPKVFENAKPYSGARKAMKELYKNNNIIIVTEQPNGFESITLKWLKDYKIPYNSLVFTKNKNMIKGEILLDDAIHHLANFDGLGVCMNRPWNREWEGLKVNDLEEFILLVEDIKNQQIK